MSFSTLVFILIFTPTKHTLKEEVGMAELGMSLIWMVGLEFWFFWVLCFFFFFLCCDAMILTDDGLIWVLIEVDLGWFGFFFFF